MRAVICMEKRLALVQTNNQPIDQMIHPFRTSFKHIDNPPYLLAHGAGDAAATEERQGRRWGRGLRGHEIIEEVAAWS